MAGQEVCRLHGGATPVARERAAEKLAFAQAEGEVAEMLHEYDMPELHPIDGLLEVVRHTGGMMRMLGALVGTLDIDPHGLVFKMDNEALHGFNHAGDQAAHVLVTLYGVWSDRYARACKLALDANIDERLVRNAESTTSAIYGAIESALIKAQLTPEQAGIFTRELGASMRRLMGPGQVFDVPTSNTEDEELI
jgi:hypothetical protein